ncbi:hypothetical protein [Marinobacter bohaiensis]|uniref:hypothetical protein n=1 Tax=Marinobacter bohaiensis TaxID=2201898 RepID=UPI000DABD2EB|nr:hypothetical protein [Marinobacter bohaiensis]
MDDIQALASAISSETLSRSWPYFLSIGLLTLVSGAVGAFLSSYFGRRGEHKAIAADFDLIKQQLKDTTEITESIRGKLDHTLNRRHAIETLRREKLECYVAKAIEASENLSREMNEKLFNSKVDYEKSAFSTATMLQKLYFPEFDQVHAQFQIAHAEFQKWLVEGMKYLADQRSQGVPLPIPNAVHLDRYSDYYQQVLRALTALEEAARDLGRQLIQDDPELFT